MTSLPVLGAAMPLDTLETHRDWLIADQRDLELQDFITAEVLNGDWQPLVARARALLDGYTCRLGIHGPFWGLTLDNPDPEIRAIVTKRMEQGLAVCEALGATQMVIHSPYTTWDYNNLDMLPNARQKLLDNVHATLDPVIARAEGAGVQMVLENIHRHRPRALRAWLHRGAAGRLLRPPRGRPTAPHPPAGRGRLRRPALGHRQGHGELARGVCRARAAGRPAAADHGTARQGGHPSFGGLPREPRPRPLTPNGGTVACPHSRPGQQDERRRP